MQVKTTAAASAADNAGWPLAFTSPSVDEVAALSYGELALAVRCSEMPTDRPQGVKEDPLAYAIDGLARMGVVAIRRLEEQSQALVNRKHFGPDRPAKRTAAVEHNRLWGDARRFDRSHSMAGRLWHALADRRAGIAAAV
ncbi:hypothetical protein GA0070616_2614 [Micromonospora nigra]|uniref:Uncharacterized protein n=1 Tax=Micromonospora nigra TaxID=145857 RepID=A0A1C6S048_9ACTN|nr:hypothetical protein [Micromonospora nigra]SCL22837.1 hypothetical protein GA0070616_2614 [Micromonospora nigra]